MTSLADFIPLVQDSVADIRLRMDANVNAGLDPADPAWVDTTEGTFYWDMTQVFALELERLSDLLGTDVLASWHPMSAWGGYLELHGELMDVPRLDAAKATGVVTFTGDVAATISTGTEIAAESADPDADPVVFRTLAPAAVGIGGTVDVAIEAAVAGAAGNVPTGSITLIQSPVANVTAVVNALATTGGSEVETDEEYRPRVVAKYRAAQGAGTAADYERWARLHPEVRYVTVVPLVAGPGTVGVIVTDDGNDPVSQTVIDEIQNDLDPPVTTQLNGGETLPTGTIDVDSTERFSPTGTLIFPGNVIVTYTGKTPTTFTGATGGTGVFPDNTIIRGQGQGKGRAPIGAVVFVSSPTALNIAVEATLTLESGYTTDGAGGTIAVRDEIEEALSAYLDTLKPGEDVVLNHVISRFFAVEGVFDVSLVKIGPQTTLSLGETLPSTPIDVVSTTSFAASGNIDVGGQTVAYTAKTATQFTTATGGTGTFPVGTVVKQVAAANFALADSPAPQVAAMGDVKLS